MTTGEELMKLPDARHLINSLYVQESVAHQTARWKVASSLHSCNRMRLLSFDYALYNISKHAMYILLFIGFDRVIFTGAKCIRRLYLN